MLRAMNFGILKAHFILQGLEGMNEAGSQRKEHRHDER